MGLKAIFLLGFVLAFTLLLASEVTSNGFTKTSNVKSANGLDDAKYGGRPGAGVDGYGPAGDQSGGELYYCRHGCCHFVYGKCKRCCRFAGEVAEDAHPQAKPNN